MKFRYLVVGDTVLEATNDRERALTEAARYEPVYDCETGEILNDPGVGSLWDLDNEVLIV